ncbi:hypothetical protein HaLaN_08740, partial [Haematococcus lacustris]
MLLYVALMVALATLTWLYGARLCVGLLLFIAKKSGVHISAASATWSRVHRLVITTTKFRVSRVEVEDLAVQLSGSVLGSLLGLLGGSGCGTHLMIS